MSATDMGRSASPLRADHGLWHHLCQFPILLRLVRGLDDMYDVSKRTASSSDVAGHGARLSFYAMHRAVLLLSINRAELVLRRYARALGIRLEEIPPHRLVVEQFERSGGAQLLESASELAADASPDDGTAEYIRCLAREAVTRDPGRSAVRFVEPRNLRVAQAWVRASEEAVECGETEAAERCLRAALALAPTFNHARGLYAARLRRRGALIAASHFSTMLDYSSSLTYGDLTLGSLMANHFVCSAYRGFAVAFEPAFDAYVAQPAFLAAPRPRALGPLARRRCRFLGLLVMRVHLARRVGKLPEEQPAPGEPLPPPIVPSTAAPAWTRVRGWVIERVLPHMRFALVADTEMSLHGQIDEAYRIWLAPGSSPQATRPT